MDVPVSEILDKTFTDADSYLTSAHGIFSGCTAITALLRPECRDEKQVRALYTANVGDSRAVLYRGKQAIRLSYDHKGSDPLEQQRVRDAGGFIMNERVNGMLAITRALGDSEMKEYVAGHPYTTETVLDERDALLILACDGLWDVCEDQQAAELIAEIDDPQKAADVLVQYALDNDSYDNISVLVIRLAPVKQAVESQEVAAEAADEEIETKSFPKNSAFAETMDTAIEAIESLAGETVNEVVSQ